MLLNFDANGNIQTVVPERVYQGSNNANNIDIVSPLSLTNAMEIRFQLADNSITEPYLLTNGRVFYTDTGLNIWHLPIDENITRYAGNVRMQVKCISTGGVTIATGSTTFPVEVGVIGELPPIPEQETYEQIALLLQKLNTDKFDRVDFLHLENYPEVQFSMYGAKQPNTEFYDFEIGIGGETKKGALFVFMSGTTQTEWFFTDTLVYYRTIEGVDVGDFEPLNVQFIYDYTYSKEQINDKLNLKQDKTDNNFNTTSKTVVGSVNELKGRVDTNESDIGSLETRMTTAESDINTAESNIANLQNDKLDKNFNLLVERTYGQLTDYIALRSASDSVKMTLQTLKAYITQGLTGIKFEIVKVLPATGEDGVIYLVPMVDYIVEDLFLNFPAVGDEKTLYIATDESDKWYAWNGSAYVDYNLGYNEFIWLEEISSFEQIGTTQVDLTGYATELWATTNFVNKLVLNGGTTGQIIKKNSNDDLDFVWIDDIPANGTMFVRDPNTTELYITLASPNTFSMEVSVTAGNTIRIDWGDGATETSSGGEIPHTYNQGGEYRIVISHPHKGIKINDAVSKFNILEIYGGTNYTETLAEGFKNCKLKRAILNNVLILANQHFYGCNDLIEVSLNKATSIGNFAFRGCYNLSNIILPSATTIIGGAFYNTFKLSNVDMPVVTTLGDQAFCSSGIVNIELPKITELGRETFKDCVNLVSVYAPNVNSIITGVSGLDTFNGCTSLKELTIGNIANTDNQNRFTNVVLDKLTISGNPTTTDINRIVKFITDNGGAFSDSAEVFGNLKVAKSLGVGGQIGDVRLGILGNGVTSREPISYVPNAQQKSQTVSIQGNGNAYFYASDNTNNVEMASGISTNGNGFIGTLTDDNFEFRRGNTKMAELLSTGLSLNSKKITNLADGVGDNDAVNVSQLQTIIDNIVGV